jgi:hypothetical protein
VTPLWEKPPLYEKPPLAENCKCACAISPFDRISRLKPFMRYRNP